MRCFDVVIVGAGPYGLSAAAHLQAVNGLRVRIFGEPMSFWERHMPAGMLLRSPWTACHLSDPDGAFRFDAYTKRERDTDLSPVSLKEFVAYGHWFRRSAVSDLDPRKVASVEPATNGFRVTVQGGEQFESRQVVIATGIANFAHRPTEFSGCPSHLASHSSEHRDFSPFGARRVIVVGGGQSAFESAALLHEAGSEVEVLIRAPQLNWIWKRPWVRKCKPLRHLLFAPSDVGPPFISHLIAKPGLFRRLPRKMQDRWGSHQASIVSSLKPRLKGVSITLGRAVAATWPAYGKLRIRLDNGTERNVDHVVLATGFDVNVSRYDFLSPGLLSAIKQAAGYPKLSQGFESSVPGLYFIGAPAAWSFGPLLRFVAGAEFAAARIARVVGGAGKAIRHVEAYERLELASTKGPNSEPDVPSDESQAAG